MKQKIRDSIAKGVDFLYKNQMLHGEFKTYISSNKSMSENLSFVSTTYVSTFVLYSLSFVMDPRIADIRKRAVQFLKEEMESGGIWRFFTTNRNVRLSGGSFQYYTQIGIIPDLDDTAVVSYCLKKNNEEVPDNLSIFLDNRNDSGLFFTWLMDVPKRPEYSNNTPYWVPKQNDICSGVNANILLYLGENQYTKHIVDYLNTLIVEDRIDTSYVYFPDPMIIYYLISRAYYKAAPSLELSKHKIIEKLRALQNEDGSFSNPLNTAYAICTALNFKVYDVFLQKATEYLLSSQNENGSWDNVTFYIDGSNFYGSEEFSTALCLEALSRFEGLIAYEGHSEYQK